MFCRLASVQEQRLPCSNSSTDGRLSPTVSETPPITPTSSQHSKVTIVIAIDQCLPACVAVVVNQFTSLRCKLILLLLFSAEECLTLMD